uniref:Odorant binding protein 16 n=1 Tax=Colaphellus bowringi TaxID=561076 RepID=A0A0S3J2I7_9CUCU|nr:odorant binding protein 16 [Colaphellus bowringi]
MFKLILFCAVLLIPFVSAYLSEEDYGPKLSAVANKVHNACIKKHAVNEDTIMQVRKGNFVEDELIKKYISCIWLLSTVLDESGNLNIKIINDLCPPKGKDTLPKIYHDCHAENAGVSQLDEKVYNIMKCWYEKDPELFFVL